MQVTAKLNYLRIAPRKVRQVADLIRGKKIDQAQSILEFVVKKPGQPMLKLLKSALASAKNDFHLEESNLYIAKLLVNEAPKLKRWMPVSRGSAHPIWKRTSHIVMVLDEIKPSAKKGKSKKVKKIHPVKSREAGLAGREFNRVKEEPTKIIKPEEIKEVVREKEFVPQKAVPAGRQEKPKFERKEIKKQKGLAGLKRIFRRKAF